MKTKKIKICLLTLFISITLVSEAQNADWNYVPFRSGNLWGYATPDKQIVMKPTFDDAKLFYNGYAAVKKNGKYGYINTLGKLVIPFRYLVAKPFRYGYIYTKGKTKSDTILFAGASVRKDGYEICINTKGNILYKCPAIKENIANGEGIQMQTTSQKLYSDVSNNGQLYDMIADDYIVSNSPDKFYIANKNGLYGVFNNRQEMIVPFSYKFIKILNLNNNKYLRVVDQSNMVGILNWDGTMYLPVTNSSLDMIESNTGIVNFLSKKNDGFILLDKNMNILLEGNYKDVLYNANSGYTLVKANGMKGYYFINTGLAVPTNYTEIEVFNNDKYIKIQDANGKSGYINNAGIAFFEN